MSFVWQKKYSGYLKYLLLLLLALFFYSPLSANFSRIGGKPLDVTFSDILVFAALLIYCAIVSLGKIRRLEGQLLLLVSFVLLFFLFLGVAGYAETGSIISILSAVKYEKIFLALVAGMCFSRFCSVDDFWRISSFASLIIVLSLCFSQFVQLGSFSPRWGANIFGLPVYGFPNSPSSYYVLLVMFSVVACYRGLGASRYGGVVLLMSLFMVMSLSRGAFLVLLVFFLLVLFFVLSAQSLIKLFALLLVTIVLIFTLFSSVNLSFRDQGLTPVVDSLERRWDRTFSSSDPTSGRLDIAKETLSLVSERPVFGYKFDSFSNYHHGHDTPHNQYIEALFKTGFLGASIYFCVFFVFVWVVLRKAFSPGVDPVEKKSILCLFCAVAALLVGNLTQPNFTYSQTGNIVFFILGFLSLAELPPAPTSTNRIDDYETGSTTYG